MEILEEYLKNIQTMTSLMGELGNKNNLRRYNRLAARNRIIASVINDSIPEYKNEFLGFLCSDDCLVRLWAAHHIIEVMKYERPDRIAALKVIQFEAENNNDPCERMGNAKWLKDYYANNPGDIE